jgi:crotonobetainyl-CoA:carnitine CoA-transferase CaiB-like acyl-CoA transferase
MYNQLEGIRVVELASWVFMPAAGAVLADWGADVVKLEDRVSGDPLRGLTNSTTSTSGFNSTMAQLNRGKRSIGIDVGTPGGREVLYALLRRADVFMTSFRAPARRRLGIEVEDIRAINPKIIYARGTGQGSRGPDADKGGYDLASTWARSGMAYRLSEQGGAPPAMPGSVGDLTSGIAAAGAIAAALFRRERTGDPSTVEVSLYGMGMWIMSQSLTAAQFQEVAPVTPRDDVLNPLVNSYRTKDGRWLFLVLLQGDRFWADLCGRMNRGDLLLDRRFDTAEARQSNVKDCIRVLDEVFATRTLDEWRSALADFDGVWCPVLSPSEVTLDPQVEANGYFPPIESTENAPARLVASPMQFNDQAIGRLRPAPELGEHTELVLLELGYSWDDISTMKDVKVVL